MINKLSKMSRNWFNKYVRNNVIKDKCEVCDSDNKLHVHHNIPLVKIIHDTITKYPDYDVNILSSIVNSRSVELGFTTLCEECHKKAHQYDNLESFGVKIRKEQDLVEKREVLSNYLDSIVGKELYQEEQQELSDKIASKLANSKSIVRGKKMRPSTIEKILRDEFKLDYSFSSPKRRQKTINGKRTRRRYVILNKQID